MNRPPLDISILKNGEISTYSIDEPECVDISGCDYADMILLDEIISSDKFNENTNILQNSEVMDRIREYTKNDKIGVLTMLLFARNILIITDKNRDLKIKLE